MKGINILIGVVVLAAAAFVLTSFTSCKKATIPAGAKAVTPFDAQKYLGTWYEIARFDFKFEHGLEYVTANYSLNEDGSIKVINRGFVTAKNKWKEAKGRAVFVGDTNVAMLKVSFFGPFYAGYNVVAIDPDYKYALVVGRNSDYMWLLSREKTMPQDVIDSYLKIATDLGFDVSRLVWVAQDME